jgi:hypothetical protein
MDGQHDPVNPIVSKELTTDFLLTLYREHAAALRAVREEQRSLARQRGDVRLERHGWYRLLSGVLSSVGIPAHYKRRMKPQLDDVESEITYLLIRAFRPETVVEVAPDRGWSSTWMLRALRDNGHGHLFSYDLVDYATRTIPPDLAAGRWTFVQGDIRQNLHRLPDDIDYFFMDAFHKAFFAEWYVAHIFPLLAPGTVVEVHDVFQEGEPGKFTEGPVVLDWLEARGNPWFTAAPFSRPDAFQAITAVRREIGITREIHTAQVNPMLFFLMA